MHTADLDFKGVVGGSEKGLDAQVPLDPFEKQLVMSPSARCHLPPTLVDERDGQSGHRGGKWIENFAGFRTIRSFDVSSPTDV